MANDIFLSIYLINVFPVQQDIRASYNLIALESFNETSVLYVYFNIKLL